MNNVQSISESQRGLINRALFYVKLTICYNLFEGIIAIYIAWVKNSIALFGFGLDSLIEISAAMVAFWRLKHFGILEEKAEEKKERIARRFIALTFFALASYIAVESLVILVKRRAPSETVVGIALTLFSALIMPWLALKKKQVAMRLESQALVSESMETMICAYLSVIVLAGLILNALFGWWWADPVAALIIVYFIINEGRESWNGTHGVGTL